jgi:Pyridoxal-dependent decarboxylase conserved domain
MLNITFGAGALGAGAASHSDSGAATQKTNQVKLRVMFNLKPMVGEWLTATANTNMFTYEIAPVFILMEHECLKVILNN